MTDEYFSAAEEDDIIQVFDIYKNIIDKKDENTFMIKMSFRDVLAYTTSWCFNRKINEEKVNEIYESLKISYLIPFILHAIYDEKHTNPISKILILDGQHRVEAIRKYLATDISGQCDYNVWICIYKVNYSETNNTNMVLDMFKKINNNRIVSEEEIPDTFIMDLVNNICNIQLFKKNKAIGMNMNTNSCHQPCIHKKELNTLLTENKKLIKDSNISISELIENIQKINHKLSMKSYEDLYAPRYRNIVKEQNRYKEAVAKKFFLNLKNSLYPPDIWLKYLIKPNEL